MDQFRELLSLNVNDKTEKRKSGNQELTYLSWAWAWAEFKKIYPDAKYEIRKFSETKYTESGEVFNKMVPYMYDENTGYMVMTSVSAGNLTYEMWLPVMDGANKAMKSAPYEYETKYNGTKTVAAADMFDVNKTIMRCLVKNLAMFGLGLYIYAGEDLPEQTEEQVEEQKASLFVAIDNCKSETELKQLYKKYKAEICKTPKLLSAITEKGNMLKRGAA